MLRGKNFVFCFSLAGWLMNCSAPVQSSPYAYRADKFVSNREGAPQNSTANDFPVSASVNPGPIQFGGTLNALSVSESNCLLIQTDCGTDVREIVTTITNANQLTEYLNHYTYKKETSLFYR